MRTQVEMTLHGTTRTRTFWIESEEAPLLLMRTPGLLFFNQKRINIISAEPRFLHGGSTLRPIIEMVVEQFPED